MIRPLRLLVLPLGAALVVALSACGGGDSAEPKDSGDESSATAEESHEKDFRSIEGRWEHTGESPTAVSSLIIERDGKMEYFAEGDPDTFTGTGKVMSVGADVHGYKIHLTAVDLDGNPVEGKELDLYIKLDADKDVLEVTVGDVDDGDTREFTRAKD